MKKLRSFIVLCAVVSTAVMLGIVLFTMYLGFSRISGSLVEDASERLARTTTACIVELMNRGLDREDMLKEMEAQCVRQHGSGEGDGGSFHVYVHSVLGPPFGPGPEEVAAGSPRLGKAIATGRSVASREGDVLTGFYPIPATTECVACHDAAAGGDVLGVVEISEDLSAELSEARWHILILVLLLFPLPVVAAFLGALIIDRRLQRAIATVRHNFQEEHPESGQISPQVSLDLAFDEFNELYRWLVERLNRATDNLAVYSSVLRKLVITPDAVKDWKLEVSRMLIEMHESLPTNALFFVSADSSGQYHVNVVWRGLPNVNTKENMEAAVLAVLPSERFPTSEWEMTFEHTAAHPDMPLPELVPKMVLRNLKFTAPKLATLGGLHCAGVLLDVSHRGRTTTVEGIVSALYAVAGSLKEIEGYTSELEHFATRDPLTGLHNSRMFWELLRYDVHRAGRLGHKVAVLVVDLDRFKSVNDTYGHKFGDEFLRAVASTLLAQVREADMLARYGGDEFAVIMYAAGAEQAFLVASRIIEKFREFSVEAPDGRQVGTTVSVGVAICPDHAEAPEQLFSRADSMLYRAKGAGRNQVCLPDREVLALEDCERWATEGGLVKRALEEDLVVPYFQPILRLADRQVVAHEVLMRLELPDRVVLAGEVIEAAESVGLISDLDLTVARKAFSKVRETGYQGLLFLNLSPKALVYGRYIEELIGLVEEYGLKRDRVVLELTERETVRNLSLVERFIKNLKQEGFAFAIDDFGVGFSSLQYVRRFPVDLVKIDGEFTKGVESAGSPDRAIVSAIVALAGGLGVDSVGEHVESEQALEALATVGATHAQGFHVGKPAPEFSGPLKS